VIQAQETTRQQGWTLRAFVKEASGLREVTQTEAVQLRHGTQGTLWIDLHVHDQKATQTFLVESLGFHPLPVEDAVNPRERPKLEEYDHVLFLVGHAVSHQDHIEAYHSIAFFLSEHFLVSVHLDLVPLIDDWLARWQKDSLRMDSSPAHLLHALLDGIVDDYFPVADTLQETLDEIEEMLFDGSAQIQVAEIIRLKRRLLEFRKHITPMRDILNALLRRDQVCIPTSSLPYFQDVYDHTLRLTENIDTGRDLLSGLLDAHLALVSNRLNDIMRVLTVVATILMSAALIAGIYGMNFDYMPELHWRWGYAFALGLMVVTSVLALWIFRKKKWL
jgi:magnesium transporter